MKGEWGRGQGSQKGAEREVGGGERRRQCERRKRMETGGDKRQKEGTEREVGGRASEGDRGREWGQGEMRGRKREQKKK